MQDHFSSPHLPFRISSLLHSFPAALLFFRHPNTNLLHYFQQSVLLSPAPATWNQLPVSVHGATSVSSLKSALKTFFFSETFSSVPLLWGTSVCGVHWIFVVKILVYCLDGRLRSRYVRCLLCLCQQWGCTLRAVREILQACVMLTALFFSGKKNYLPPSYLIYGFGFLFKVSVDVGHSSTVGYEWFLINMSSCVLCIILYLHCHILKELFCRLNFLWTWRGLKGHDLQ